MKSLNKEAGRTSRTKPDVVEKQDEYTAAIREADAARKQISALETQVLEQMEQLEQAEQP